MKNKVQPSADFCNAIIGQNDDHCCDCWESVVPRPHYNNMYATFIIVNEARALDWWIIQYSMPDEGIECIN